MYVLFDLTLTYSAPDTLDLTTGNEFGFRNLKWTA